MNIYAKGLISTMNCVNNKMPIIGNSMSQTLILFSSSVFTLSKYHQHQQ